MQNYLLLGHSHVHAIFDAIEDMRAADSWPSDVHLEWMPLKSPIYEPLLTPGTEEDEENYAINQKIVHDFTDIVSRLSDVKIFTTLGGNQHNDLSLCNHSGPIDFVFGGEPVDETARIIPATVFREWMLSWCGMYLRTMKVLRDLAPSASFYHFQSPPPVESNDWIASHPGSFRARVSQYGIAPPLLRRKAWRMHSDIFRDHCRGLGVTFVPCPPHAIDEAGFMREEYRARDPIHGNSRYGRHVVRQMFALSGIDETEVMAAS